MFDEILARLGINGVIANPEENIEQYAGFVPVLRESGTLSPYFFPDFTQECCDLSKLAYSYNNVSNVKEALDLIFTELNNTLKISSALTELSSQGRQIAFETIKQEATENSSGALRIATENEIVAGTSTTTAVVPAYLHKYYLPKTDNTNGYIIDKPLYILENSNPKQLATQQYVDDHIISEFSIPTSKTLWVSENGTALIGKGLTNIYGTLQDALNNASAGDLIVVLAGNYSTNVSLVKNGVSWFFMPGAIVTSTASNSALFHCSSSINYFNVFGHGKFIANNTGQSILLSTNTTGQANIVFEADSVITTNGHALVLARNNNYVKVREIVQEITGNYNALYFADNIYDTGENHVTVDKISITYNSTGNPPYAILINGGSNNFINVKQVIADSSKGIHISGLSTNEIHIHKLTCKEYVCYVSASSITDLYINGIAQQGKAVELSTNATLKIIRSSLTAAEHCIHLAISSHNLIIRDSDLYSGINYYCINSNSTTTVNLRGYIYCNTNLHQNINPDGGILHIAI